MPRSITGSKEVAMRKLWTDQAWIVGLAAAIYFTQLAATRLWDLDEPLYAACAREMAERGDWVVPVFNGELFHDKPPLMFWTMIAGGELFGWNEFGMRFFSAVFGVLTALAVYHLGRLLFDRRTGFWAAVVMTVNVLFTISARAATVDAALTLATTLAFGALVLGGRRLFAPLTMNADRPDADEPDADRADADRVDAAGPCSPPLPAACFRSLPAETPRDRGSAVPTLAWPWAAVMWAAMGVAVLAKGPVGLLLPAAAIGLFLMLQLRAERGAATASRGHAPDRDPRFAMPTVDAAGAAVVQESLAAGSRPWADQPGPLTAGAVLMQLWGTMWAIVRWVRSLFDARLFFRALWTMRPITGVVLVALVALPWYYLVAERTDGVWLREFMGKYNLGPFVKPFMGHHGPFFYHFVMVFVGLFPWSLFLGPVLYHAYRRMRRGEPWAAGTRLAACWAGVWFVFWSVCSTKLPHYVLPAYPALSMLTGCFLTEWLAEPARFRAAWSRNAAWTLIVVGVLLGIGGATAAHLFVPGEERVGLVGVPLIVGGLICAGYHRRGDLRRFVPAVAATGAAFLLALFGWAAARIDRHQHSPELVAAVRARQPDAPLAAFRFLQASLVYYNGKRMPRFESPEQAAAYLERTENGMIVALAAHEAELRRGCPMPLRVVARHPRFLAPGEVLVFARDAQSNALSAENRSASGDLRR